MKLAYFTNTYPRATDTFIRREVLGLRTRGFNVNTYSVHKTGAKHDVDDEVINEKANTYYLFPANPLTLLLNTLRFLFLKPRCFIKALVCAFKTKRPGIKGSILQCVYFLEAISLGARLEKDNIQHIHNHFGDNSGSVTLFASLLTDIPFSISIHGPHIFFDALYWALDVKARHARFITCIGAYCRSQLMLYTSKDDWHKFKIVRCGIDPKKLEYNTPKTDIETLMYVGRLDAEKGVPVLFDSIALLNSRGHHIKLELLGDGADRQYLEQLAKDLNIAEQINFRGFVNQDTIASMLRSSNIFILPSFAEGIPVSFMESMAAGVPVVATNVGGVTELVIHGETGLVAHASDEVGLADCVEQYIKNPDLYISISKKAREKVVSEFFIEDQVDILAKLFLGAH